MICVLFIFCVSWYLYTCIYVYIYTSTYIYLHIYVYTLYISGLDTNGCPLGNSKFILLSDNLNICLWLSDCQVEKIDQINNPWWTIYYRLSQLDLQCTHSCNFYLFRYALKRINSDIRATLDPSMGDLLHIASLEGILLVVDEAVLPTLTMWWDGWPVAQKATLCGWCASGRWPDWLIVGSWCSTSIEQLNCKTCLRIWN